MTSSEIEKIAENFLAKAEKKTPAVMADKIAEFTFGLEIDCKI